MKNSRTAVSPNRIKGWPFRTRNTLRRRVPRPHNPIANLRWRIQESEISRLSRKQFELLQTAAKQVRAGGILVYSTCSVEPEENEEVVRKFCEAASDFRLEQERTLLPFRDAVDGAYVAGLRRN